MSSRRLYAYLLLLGLIVLGGGVITAMNVSVLVFEGNYLPYGSRLITHTYVPKEKTYPRVVLLGNSVLQYTPLVQELRSQRNALGKESMFEVANYGVVGASIADLLFMYEFVRQFKPDVLLVELTPHIFFSGEPLLRTEMKGMVLFPEYRRLLALPPIRKAYRRDDWADALVYGYFPPYRLVPLVRQGLKDWIYSTGFRITDMFPWRLNRAEEWRTAQPPQGWKEGYSNSQEYPESEFLLKALLARLREDRVRVLFVLQERKQPLTSAERKLIEWTRGDPLARTLDLSGNFKSEELPDEIHFNPVGAHNSAARILPPLVELVRATLMEPHP